MRWRPPVRYNRGFTLVELLVALTIMAFFLGIVVSGLSLSVRTAEAVESGIASAEQVHLVHQALRRQIELALPLQQNGHRAAGRLDFAGEQKTLSFVAPLAGPQALKGLYRVTLVIEDDALIGGDGGRLVLKLAPLNDRNTHNLADSPAHTQVILEGIRHAEFSYGAGSASVRDDWGSQWLEIEVLPQFVRLRLSMSGLVVPDLVVALKTTVSSRHAG